jgi:putative FmdB family regulatory protein
MPIYEFVCATCGHRFSALFRRATATEEGACPPCPACQSAATQRALSTFAVQGAVPPSAGEVAAQRHADNRAAAVTSKEQISSWRASTKKQGQG